MLLTEYAATTNLVQIQDFREGSSRYGLPIALPCRRVQGHSPCKISKIDILGNEISAFWGQLYCLGVWSTPQTPSRSVLAHCAIFHNLYNFHTVGNCYLLLLLQFLEGKFKYFGLSNYASWEVVSDVNCLANYGEQMIFGRNWWLLLANNIRCRSDALI